MTKILYTKGYRVLGIGRNAEALESLKADLRDSFDYVIVDLIKKESIDKVTNYVNKYLGRIDVFINNAGYGICKELIKHDLDDVEYIFLVNTIRPLQLVDALLKYMDRGSIIVNVITLTIYTLSTSLPSYGAAK